MFLWRISNHADPLGTGGLWASGRWHTSGRPVVYLAESAASALLEVLVLLELDEESMPSSYQLLKVEAADDLPREEIDASSLPPEWRDDESVTQALGDAWLKRGDPPLLRFPSAIAPDTWNWMLNPRNPRAREVTILRAQKHLFDSRLFRKEPASA